ncbi:hypothetical protein AGMMS49975_08140 [Clostridia bacterium]|nr:hypothetical protein AGMMS49975_08140 [Clostridia bacterium]
MSYMITDEKFINPYNFVSINDDVERGTVSYGDLSGVISCEIETLTPLFIPNTTNTKAFSDKYSHSYDFFSYEDLSGIKDCNNHFARPIIPGASVRGTMRSAFEAALNGCMSTCDDENTLYRRTPVPRDCFGIIEKDGNERVLYKASKWEYPIHKRGSHKTGENLEGGIYLRGENFPNKESDAIMKYEYDGGSKIEIARFLEDSPEWANFVSVWRLYQSRVGEIKGVNQTKSHGGYKGYLTAYVIPVYYAKVGDFYYLSPSAITKEVFSHTLKKLLEKQGGHNPCVDGKTLCPACALFGMVGKEESLATRISFKDALPSEDLTDYRDYYDKERTLPVLSSPKVSATEFYMENIDGAEYFNYDYFVNYRGRGRNSETVFTTAKTPKLRGRKFYWHKKNPVLDNTENFPNQRTQIRPIKSGKKFKFEISFERLTRYELETLLWVLTFGEDNEHAHKLGHGKPVGYGSVRITHAEVKLITLNDDLSLTERQESFTPKKPQDTLSLREYLKMTDFSKVTDDVGYPIGDKGTKNSPNVYEWFGINKEIRLGGFNPSFNYVLPKPLDADIYLPKYKRGDGPKGGNRNDITPAPRHKPDAVVSPQIKQTGVSIGEMLTAKESKSSVKRAVYGRNKLKIAIGNFKINPTSKKTLEEFVRGYESDPEYYKDFKQLYENIKRKLVEII